MTKTKTSIITHRGLEPGVHKLVESSREAFEYQLKRGYGLEFDVAFSQDGQVVIFHDKDISRVDPSHKKTIADSTLDELLRRGVDDCHLITFDELTKLICANPAPMNALHFKGYLQTQENLDILSQALYRTPQVLPKLLIFDLKIEIAKRLKCEFSDLHLAASVAHQYDVKRFNQFVDNTLMTIEEFLTCEDLFSYAWLDEWDKQDSNGRDKVLYNKTVFTRLRDHGIKIALVTPELHSSSPGLLASESHEDAHNVNIYFARAIEIVRLKPDIICTDYPTLYRGLLMQDDLLGS